MPRAPRIWFPGAWYHIMARGDNREPIFFAEGDYLTYLRLLSEAAARYRCRIHAYALMTNHVHLMVETGPVEPMAKPMQWLQTSYASYIHRKYRRVGHVFQGRYRSILVERDSYALELSRYIHLNPVRAHLVRDPLDHPWSSYGAYMGQEGVGVVRTEQLLGMISPNPAEQRERYRQFVLEGLNSSRDLMKQVRNRQFLGSPEFVENPRGQTPTSSFAQGSDPCRGEKIETFPFL